jgi:mersacidin/lichenicidin family type 2 lantibiotic
MSRIDIIRAWKDEAYRNSLSQADRNKLPDNPAGAVELSEAEAEAVDGGAAYFNACSPCAPTHGGAGVAKF